MAKVMGYKSLLYTGTAGTTASSLLEKVRNIKYSADPQTGDTTSRGASTSVPLGTASVTRINATITFSMLCDDADTLLPDLLAAALTGAPVAMKYLPFAGATDIGFDGDVILKMDDNAELGSEKTYDFTATPTTDGGRQPVINAPVS
jgi:hypothetical protein